MNTLKPLFFTKIFRNKSNVFTRNIMIHEKSFCRSFLLLFRYLFFQFYLKKKNKEKEQRENSFIRISPVQNYYYFLEYIDFIHR